MSVWFALNWNREVGKIGKPCRQATLAPGHRRPGQRETQQNGPVPAAKAGEVVIVYVCGATAVPAEVLAQQAAPQARPLCRPKTLSNRFTSGHYLVNTMPDDAELLRRFVETGTEAPFRELVDRHLGLVYHAAVRQLGSDRQLADDVAQSVFLLLAEKAATLRDHPSLAAWLHATTRFKVGHALRAERRRRLRETTAVAMSDLASDFPAADWERIRPVLDEVLLELDEADRDAVLLRYFENQPIAEIAVRLQTTEAATYKRVERALAKLQVRLSLRGVTSSAAAFALLLESQAAAAVPAGLAASVAGGVMAAGTSATTVAGLSFMSAKTTFAIAAAAVLLTGSVAVYQTQTLRILRERERSAEQENRRLEAQRVTARAPATTPPVAATTSAAGASVRGSASAPGGASSMDAQIREGAAFLKAHPEVEAALIANFNASLRYQYAELIKSLGLSDADVDRFVAVLIRGRRRIVGEHLLGVTAEPIGAGTFARELKEVLGEAGYRQYLAFERNSTARGLVQELTRSLYYTDAPLSPGQISEFRRVVNEVLDEPTLGRRYTSMWTNMPAPLWDRILQRSPGVLSPAQIELLNDLGQQSKFWIARSEALRSYNERK